MSAPNGLLRSRWSPSSMLQRKFCSTSRASQAPILLIEKRVAICASDFNSALKQKQKSKKFWKHASKKRCVYQCDKVLLLDAEFCGAVVRGSLTSKTFATAAIHLPDRGGAPSAAAEGQAHHHWSQGDRCYPRRWHREQLTHRNLRRVQDRKVAMGAYHGRHSYGEPFSDNYSLIMLPSEFRPDCAAGERRRRWSRKGVRHRH
jgi:hypothetical protein